MQDIRYAVRMLLENPAFSLVAILSNGISCLQTQFGNREGHEARRVGLEAMPLDQHIEGRHRERQPRLKRHPGPMHHLLEVTDQRQHREHRLHQHAVLLRAVLTQCEIGRIPLGGMEGGSATAPVAVRQADTSLGQGTSTPTQ